jgi:hypothetical protein
MEDTEWKDWREYGKQITVIPGLKVLSRTPFILKLLTDVLPRLRDRVSSFGGKLSQLDVYAEFIQQFFEREMWKSVTQGEIPLLEDRLVRLGDLACRFSQQLFANALPKEISKWQVLMPQCCGVYQFNTVYVFKEGEQ